MVGKDYDLMQEYLPFDKIPLSLRPDPTLQEDAIETSDTCFAVKSD